MRRRAVFADSRLAVVFSLVLLARSAAGAQDGVQASNRQQVQQAQQGQNSGDRSDFLFIPALIALAAAQRQYRAQLTPAYTPYTTTTTATTVTAATPAAAAAALAQQQSSSGSGAGYAPYVSDGSTLAEILARSPAGSSAAQQAAAAAPKSSGKPADPAGTILDLSTGQKAAPTGTPAASAGDASGTARPPIPVTPTPAAVSAPITRPGYTLSPGAPGDPPGTVLIMVPGTQAAAGPPSSTVSDVTPGSSSSGSSSSSSGGSASNSLTVIEVTTTAPPGNASTTSTDSNIGNATDDSSSDSDTDVTDDGPFQGQGDSSDDEEPVVNETPPSDQQGFTGLQTATPTPPVSAPAPAGGMAAMPSATGAAAAPPPFVFKQGGPMSDKILIGCALPFEGDQKVVGQAVFEAARMAIIDKAPMLLPGVTVNLTCINSKCVDIPTYNAVYDLAEQGAVGVIGEVCSGASVAAAGVSNAKRLPIISPSSTTPSLSKPDFFFRVIPSDTYQGSAVADLVSNRGLRNIGLVYEDTPYGYGLGFSFIAAFTAHGGNVPVVVMFKRGQGNVTDTISQLAAGKASSQYPLDGVFISTGNVSFVSDLLVAAQSADLDLPLFGGDATANPELAKALAGRPSAINNFTVVSPFPGDPAFMQKFANFIKQSNTDPLAAESVFAARGYDAMTALLQAYAAAQGARDGPSVIAALQRQNFTGASGEVAFDKNGDLIATDRTYVFGQLTPKGSVKVDDFIDISD